MKRLFLALATVGALAVPAAAADLARPVYKAPVAVVAPVMMWNGFYVGGNIGYGFSGNDLVGANDSGTFLGDLGRLKNSGVLGGGQIGWNTQFGGTVLGIEADLQASDVGDSFLNAGFRTSSQIKWFGTVRGRLGYAFDNVLVYATGGLAYGKVDYNFDDYAWSSKTRTGYAVGGGIEYAFAPAWSVKAEYLYVNFGRYTVGDASYSTQATPDFHLVRLGVNYRFNWAAPVVASY